MPDPSRATVAEYLGQWLNGALDPSPKTLERYRELAERQVIPYLGNVALQKLKAEHVSDWHAKLIASGLSAQTVVHAHRVLSLTLRRAVENGTLARNVAALRRPPKVEPREVEILSPSQVAAVLASLADHPLHPIASLALATGMRRSELLALQWSDVDLDRAVVRVERSVEETKAGLRLKAPKTKRGRRSINLPADTVAVLRAHKVQQMELRLAIGAGAIKPATLVFSNINGELLRPRNLTKAWDRARAAMKLPAVTFHAFRHTHVSLLIAKGVDILTISRRLGHSKAAITLDVYGHLIDGADEAAAAALEGMLK